ncbi:MAG: hypothetical protein IJ710_08520 [Prevotella sp.]|nr:hypothetical protein [Prevotella sp.]
MRTFLCWLLAKMTTPAVLGVLMLFCIFDMVSEQKLDIEEVKQWALIVVPIDIVLSGWATVFAYKNFNEVISRNKRWRNSNVERFDMRIWYCIAVFVKCLLAIPFIALVFATLIYVVRILC